MIENSPPKGVSFSDLICTFAMSIVGFSCLFCNTKISEFFDMTKSWATFVALVLKSLIYNSVAELRIFAFKIKMFSNEKVYNKHKGYLEVQKKNWIWLYYAMQFR